MVSDCICKKEIDLQRIALCERAISHFAKIQFADPTISLDSYLDFIRRGEWILYGIFEDNIHVGSVACVVEIGDLGKEFYIALGASQGQKGASLRAILPTLEQIAKDSGCLTIRTSTAIPALVRLYQSADYNVSEYILRKVL